ncbi:MAG: flagellar biosynthesis regulator FlaF [Paracoccaceae bacterium]
MNQNIVALKAYAGVAAATRTPRRIEYELFGQVTRRLIAARAGGSDNLAPMAAALNDNLRLWTSIAADVAEAGNGLPPQLKARLFYLYEFTRAHTRKVLSGKADAEVLVDINTAVMRGLSGEGPAR